MRKIENFNANNFDLVRLIAALLVLVTHGFELLGALAYEPLYNLSGGTIRFSTIGLYLFFFTSGFLVTNSFFKTKKIGEFIWKRFLRIYPALLLVVLITAFIIGPIFTSISLKNYFLSSETYKYLITVSGIHIRLFLPGVFESAQHFDHGVNGSLWSIGHEIKLYLLLIAAGIIYKKGFKTVFYFVAVMVLIFNFFVNVDFSHLQNYFDPLHTNLFFIFWIGSLCCIHYKKIILDLYLLLILFVIWLLCVAWFQPARLLIDPLFFSYFTLYCCYTPKTISLKIDLSYGIYIYAFLINQTIIEIWGRMSPLKMISLILACVIPVSLLSWFFIEKKALAQKNKYDVLFGSKKKIVGAKK